LRFLRDEAGLMKLMDPPPGVLAPQFRRGDAIFSEVLGNPGGATWTVPKGGYFISLDVPPGCATQVVELANEAGGEVTPAGATHPHGKDPHDRNIRIAPSFPELPEVALAAEGVAVCVLLAATESLLRQRMHVAKRVEMQAAVA